MQIRSSLITIGGAFIGMTYEDIVVAFFVYGKNEAYRVVREHALGDPNVDTVLSDIDRSLMPNKATKQTVELKGTFVITLGNMATYAAALADGVVAAFVGGVHRQVFSLFLSDEPSVKDGLMGYCDDKGEHYIAAFFSKEQGEVLVDEMRNWLPMEQCQRIKGHIRSSALPKQCTSRQVISIEGQIASFLNCAYMMQKGAFSGSTN